MTFVSQACFSCGHFLLNNDWNHTLSEFLCYKAAFRAVRISYVYLCTEVGEILIHLYGYIILRNGFQVLIFNQGLNFGLGLQILHIVFLILCIIDQKFLRYWSEIYNVLIPLENRSNQWFEIFDNFILTNSLREYSFYYLLYLLKYCHFFVIISFSVCLLRCNNVQQ